MVSATTMVVQILELYRIPHNWALKWRTSRERMLHMGVRSFVCLLLKDFYLMAPPITIQPLLVVYRPNQICYAWFFSSSSNPEAADERQTLVACRQIRSQ
jgi:hypothetical protein